MQYAVHSGIVPYGGGDIVLVQKGQTSGRNGCSMQWTQWNNGIWWCVCCVLHPVHPLVWPFWHQRHCPNHHIPLFHCIHRILRPLFHCIHFVMHPLVWPFCIKDNVPTNIYHYSTASTAYCVHWFDLFVSKTMSPPSYTTIPLHTASICHGCRIIVRRGAHKIKTVSILSCIYWLNCYWAKN